MVLRVRKRMGQAIKFSSFGLHLSEAFHDMALEQYEMERAEQVHISMSEIAAGLFLLWFSPVSPHRNLTSTIKLWLHVHEYAQVLCMSAFKKNPSVNILHILKIQTCFLELGILTVFAIFHLRVSSFSKNCKFFWKKSMSIEGGLPHKEPQGLGPASSFQLSGPGKKRSGGSYRGWGTACGVGGFSEICFGWGEKKLYSTKFENNLTLEDVVFDVPGLGALN